MKRFLILLLLLLLYPSISTAEDTITEAQFCAVASENETSVNGISKVINNVTGANFATSKAAELAIQKAIKTQLGSNVNVEIYPYTLSSILQGKFKTMTVDAKSLNLGGLYVSDFNASTICDYNQVAVKDNNLLFKENFVMKFSGKINDADLQKTMTTAKYLNLVDSVKLSTFGQTLIKLNNVQIGIKGDKLLISGKIFSPIIWGLDQKTITATSGLSVEDGKIKYTDIKIMGLDGSKYINSLLSLINLINPFTFDIKLSKDMTGYTSVKNVIIKDNTISIDGILYIPKNN